MTKITPREAREAKQAKKKLEAARTVPAVVTEALPNTMFRVVAFEGTPEEKEVIGHLSGKMRYHRIKVLIGDKVDILLDEHGGEKGRIIKRY